LQFAATLLSRHIVRLVRDVAVAAALVYGLGWKVAGGGPAAAALAGVALALVLGWHIRMLSWLANESWTSYLLDLPRRRRAIAGPGPGTWATDVVPDRERYVVLLLHFADRGDPSPLPAESLPSAPWGHSGRMTGPRTRTIVALQYADDPRAAWAAAERLRAPAEERAHPTSGGSDRGDERA